jgi:hypothetical protein
MIIELVVVDDRQQFEEKAAEMIKFGFEFKHFSTCISDNSPLYFSGVFTREAGTK